MTAYRCPNCKTNRTRFHIIEQVPRAVKLDPATGEIVETYNAHELEPFHLPYQGPKSRIQCAICGLIEDEQLFIKFAEH